MKGARRRAAAAMGLAILATTCSRRPQSEDPTQGYLESAAFRRAELVASLQSVDNDYSRVRLEHYATTGPGAWDGLPAWNPRVEPIAVAEMAAQGGASLAAPLTNRASALVVTATDAASLARLGEQAFFRYPVQLAPIGGARLSSGELDSYGLWRDPIRGVGGLVRAAMADGTTRVELTCATCHAARDRGGNLVAGLPNSELDLGAMMAAASDGQSVLGQRLLAWGRGRTAVTPEDDSPPIRIPDLRPTRWLTHLQTDGAVVQRNIVSLAIRLETLIITSHHEQVRPPRLVALALAVYLWKLSDSLPPPEGAAAGLADTGKLVFDAHCRGCHGGPGLTGQPRPLAMIGTDPTVGLSKDRGTGLYRVPSLRGLSTRGPLLHDASVASAADLFDPNRLNSTFLRRLHGTGGVDGHIFGLELAESSRRALVAYLNSL